MGPLIITTNQDYTVGNYPAELPPRSFTALLDQASQPYCSLMRPTVELFNLRLEDPWKDGNCVREYTAVNKNNFWSQVFLEN